MKKQLTLYLLLFTFTFCLFTCDTTDPPPVKPPPDNGNKEKKITLTVDDTSPTEVWLKLITENIILPDTFSLFRNNSSVKTFELTDSNYIIYKDSLLPSQSYTYKVTTDTVTSNEAVAVTMDTTGHNFSYEIFEFGEHGNSALRDVAIIDENNIWAVGAIYLKDSTGANDSKLYNILHWNGAEWDLSRATNVPLNTIHAFSNNDIWAFSSAPYHYDGVSWISHNISGLFNGYAYGSWGTSSNDLYMVGGNGSIAHYNGSSWSKLESGTELTLSDVYGTNGNEVYVSGVEVFKSGIVLKGNSTGFKVLKNSGYVSESELFETLYGELGSVWIDEKGTLYTAGSYLYWQRRGQWDFVNSLPENYYQANISAEARGYITGIKGNASNDYVLIGGRNTLQHFNGISWQQIGVEYSPSSPIIWRGIEQKGDLIIGVGELNNKALIIKLKR